MNTTINHQQDALCRCGCGEAAPIAKRTNARIGQVKGQTLPYLAGHNSRGRITPEYVASRMLRDPHTDCWNWTGPLDRKGYGRVQVNGRHQNAHRAVYELVLGRSLPKAVVVDHLCRNRRCCNPRHMKAVSSVENTRRGALAKLTRADAERIRADLRTQGAIAAEFGIARQTVSDIQRGRRWRQAAARDALSPTVTELQASAVELYSAMIDVAPGQGLVTGDDR